MSLYRHLGPVLFLHETDSFQVYQSEVTSKLLVLLPKLHNLDNPQSTVGVGWATERANQTTLTLSRLTSQIGFHTSSKEANQDKNGSPALTQYLSLYSEPNKETIIILRNAQTIDVTAFDAPELAESLRVIIKTVNRVSNGSNSNNSQYAQSAQSTIPLNEAARVTIIPCNLTNLNATTKVKVQPDSFDHSKKEKNHQAMLKTDSTALMENHTLPEIDFQLFFKIQGRLVFLYVRNQTTCKKQPKGCEKSIRLPLFQQIISFASCVHKKNDLPSRLLVRKLESCRSISAIIEQCQYFQRVHAASARIGTSNGNRPNKDTKRVSRNSMNPNQGLASTTPNFYGSDCHEVDQSKKQVTTEKYSNWQKATFPIEQVQKSDRGSKGKPGKLKFHFTENSSLHRLSGKKAPAVVNPLTQRSASSSQHHQKIMVTKKIFERSLTKRSQHQHSSSLHQRNFSLQNINPVSKSTSKNYLHRPKPHSMSRQLERSGENSQTIEQGSYYQNSTERINLDFKRSPEILFPSQKPRQELIESRIRDLEKEPQNLCYETARNSYQNGETTQSKSLNRMSHRKFIKKDNNEDRTLNQSDLLQETCPSPSNILDSRFKQLFKQSGAEKQMLQEDQHISEEISRFNSRVSASRIVPKHSKEEEDSADNTHLSRSTDTQLFTESLFVRSGYQIDETTRFNNQLLLLTENKKASQKKLSYGFCPKTVSISIQNESEKQDLNHNQEGIEQQGFNIVSLEYNEARSKDENSIISSILNGSQNSTDRNQEEQGSLQRLAIKKPSKIRLEKKRLTFQQPSSGNQISLISLQPKNESGNIKKSQMSPLQKKVQINDALSVIYQNIEHEKAPKEVAVPNFSNSDELQVSDGRKNPATEPSNALPSLPFLNLIGGTVSQSVKLVTHIAHKLLWQLPMYIFYWQFFRYRVITARLMGYVGSEQSTMSHKLSEFVDQNKEIYNGLKKLGKNCRKILLGKNKKGDSSVEGPFIAGYQIPSLETILPFLTPPLEETAIYSCQNLLATVIPDYIKYLMARVQQYYGTSSQPIKYGLLQHRDSSEDKITEASNRLNILIHLIQCLDSYFILTNQPFNLSERVKIEEVWEYWEHKDAKPSPLRNYQTDIQSLIAYAGNKYQLMA